MTFFFYIASGQKKDLKKKNVRSIGLANGKTTVCYNDVNLSIKGSLKIHDMNIKAWGFLNTSVQSWCQRNALCTLLFWIFRSLPTAVLSKGKHTFMVAKEVQDICGGVCVCVCVHTHTCACVDLCNKRKGTGNRKLFVFSVITSM